MYLHGSWQHKTKCHWIDLLLDDKWSQSQIVQVVTRPFGLYISSNKPYFISNVKSKCLVVQFLYRCLVKLLGGLQLKLQNILICGNCRAKSSVAGYYLAVNLTNQASDYNHNCNKMTFAELKHEKYCYK